MVTCSTHVGCSLSTYSSVVERSIADTFYLMMLLLLFQYREEDSDALLLLYICVVVREEGNFHAN